MTASAEFLPLEGELKKLGWPAAARDALVLIDEAADRVAKGLKGEICSGSFISDRGHILTAAHCFDSCFFSQQNQLVLSWPPLVRRDFRKQAAGDKCRVRVNGVETTVRVQIMAACAGETTISIAKAIETGGYHPQMEKCRNEVDIAVALPDQLPENFRCFQADLARNADHMGNDIFVMGRPRASARKASANSDGQKITVSYGKVVRQNHCDRRDGKRLQIPEYFRVSGKLEQATFDILHGSSGSPVFRGEQVIGVVSLASGRATTTDECFGDAFYEPTSALEDLVEKQDTDLRMSDLNCDQRRALALPTKK